MEQKITIVQDKRRKLKNGKYPIKVRVWIPSLKKAKRVTTGVEMTLREFDNSWNSNKRLDQLAKEDRANYSKLLELLKRAEEAAESMDYFDFKGFEGKLRRKRSDKTSATYHFNKTINEFLDKGRIGAAESYRSAKISLQKFYCSCSGLTYDREMDYDIQFLEITPKWLENYEDYMVVTNGRSLTTVAIYTRTLRVIFNNAIRDNDIDNKGYPFGKGKYEIPEEKKVKKTLRLDQVKVLKEAILPPLQEKARDYWFFSYACKGMNFKDIALLKYENMGVNEFSYYREKTKLKKRTNRKKITVRLNSVSSDILNKYKNKYEGPEGYVFPILSQGDTPKVIFKKVNNWIRATNQQLKHIAKEFGFPEGFSTYWARHSYATNMINIGASMERIMEDLNHSDIQTTQNYFDGFEDTTKDELMEKLINY